MSKNARLRTRTTRRGDKLVFRRLGYSWVVDLDKSVFVPKPSRSGPRPKSLLGKEPIFLLLEAQEIVAEYTLRLYRIFDWENRIGKTIELEPAAAAAIDLIRSIKDLRVVMESDDALPIVRVAMQVGESFERLKAQVAWANRNPPPSANENKQANVLDRRNALADFIGSHGERPEVRPGKWYDDFRAEHPKYRKTDKTLKADYPHALALVRKQKKTGSNKRS